MMFTFRGNAASAVSSGQVIILLVWEGIEVLFRYTSGIDLTQLRAARKRSIKIFHFFARNIITDSSASTN